MLGMDETSTLPYFLELLSVRDSGIEKLPISPEARKERIIEALKTIVLKGAERRHLVIAIEDLHWIDESSEEVLKHLLASIPGARVLLIFTYRLEFMPKWGVKSYHTQLNLNRFSERDSHVMVTHILHTKQFEKDLEQLILDQTEGIPLFIEEFVKALRELKIIEKSNGTYHLAKNVDTMIIPSTIQDIIMARVDALPEGARKVLQTGAVIEREFSYELIRRVAGLLERELLSHMSVLKDSELIYERGIFPQSSYIFKHALTREAVYDSILTNRKKRLHEQIAFAMEELYEGNLEQHYGALAEHYAAAESYENAAKYYRLAAQKAEKTASMNDAIAYATKRVGCLEKMPTSDEIHEKRVHARADLGLYLLQMLHYREAKDAIVPIADAASATRYDTRLPQILTIMGSYEFLVEEDVATALQHFQQALDMSDESNDVVSLLFSSYRFGLALCLNCEFEKGAYLFNKSLKIMTKANNLWGISRTKAYLSYFAYWFNGHVDLAYQTSDEAVRLAEESGDTYSKAIAYTCYGASCFGKRLLDDAKRNLLKGADFSEKLGFSIFHGIGVWTLGDLYFEIGDYRASNDHHALAVRILEDIKSVPSWLATNRAGSARARVMMNDKDIHLGSDYDFGYQNKLPIFDSWKRAYTAELLLNIDEKHLEEARDCIKQAIGADKQRGMIWHLARDHARYAELFKRNGDLPKAREQLSKAIEIFKDCGADGWVTKTEEEMAKLS